MSDLSDFKRVVYEPQMESMRRLLAEKQERISALEEALRHYADERHWDDVTPGAETNTAGYPVWEYDGGNELPWSVARAALADKEGT